MSPRRVFIGLSGGVDSSVSAYLLKDQGYDVEAVFMKNWTEEDDDTHCTAAADLADAEAICNRLGVPLHTVNFATEYWDRVFEYFLQEYEAGRTPNPDILCNREIKFKAFLDHALAAGADYIATGHYAGIRQQGSTWQLIKGDDPQKDQSYFLYALSQKALAHTLFPLANWEKSQVRAVAKQHGLITHNKKDSTGICFIGEKKFKTFLQQYLPAKPGPIKTPQGERLGQHDGLMYYTIGQRGGLGLGGQRHHLDQPWYVLKKHLPTNTLIVGQGQDHPALWQHRLTCQQIHWIDGQLPKSEFSATAKIRYRQADQVCQVIPRSDEIWEVEFEHPQRAIAAGQSIVFYQEEICLGGGIIAESTNPEKLD